MYYERLMQELNKLVEKSEKLVKEKETAYDPVKDQVEESKLKLKIARSKLKEESDIIKKEKDELNQEIHKELETPNIKTKERSKELLKKMINIDDKEFKLKKTNEDLKELKKSHNELIRPYANKRRKLSEEIHSVNKTIFRRIKAK